MRKLILLAWLLALTQGIAAHAALAQDYPNRPIKMIVPYPPGGSVDPVARILAAAVADRLRQPVVIENRARRGRRDRHGCGREGPAGRLHAAVSFLGARDRAELQEVAAL